jgi:D-3-phosphoglycerate dehydrogenase
MVGTKQLGLMKTSSYLVNVSRGAVVDEEALLKALREGRIAGAALDVWTKEPNTDSPLFQLPNVICTPHVAGTTVESQLSLEMTVAEEALRIAEGKRPKTIANEEALEHRRH